MIQLRPYQNSGFQAVVSAARMGHTNAVLCSPVGSGKSVMMAELCRVAKRPVVVSPSLSLLYQLVDNLKVWLDEPVDVEQGQHRAEFFAGLRRRVICASRDSLLSNSRYKGQAFDDTSLVIVDECHVGVTPRLIGMLRHFEQHGAFIVGLSATPYKSKGKPLPYWSRPCFSYSLLEAIEDGWLVRPKVHLSQVKSVDLSLVDEVAHEWDKKQLAAVLTAEHTVQEIASLVLQTFKLEPSAVYCHCVSQAKLVAEVLQRYGHKVSIVYSKQLYAERQANMEAFRSGESKIIVNVGVLSYGWDHPELRNIYNAAPTQSLSRYEQRIGRGTRPLSGVLASEMTKEERLAAIAASAKPEFQIYDITDSSRSLKLVNALDVLDAKSSENPERRARMMAKMEDGADILEEKAEQDEIDREQMLLAARELKQKRQKLIVGMTFDHESVDPFQKGAKKKGERGARMLWGPYKGQLIRTLPTKYLQYAYGKERKKESWHGRALANEIDKRLRNIA